MYSAPNESHASTLLLSRQLYDEQVALLLQRGRAMLCPSVVSLNKIITRAESLIIVT